MKYLLSIFKLCNVIKINIRILINHIFFKHLDKFTVRSNSIWIYTIEEIILVLSSSLSTITSSKSIHPRFIVLSILVLLLIYSRYCSTSYLWPNWRQIRFSLLRLLFSLLIPGIINWWWASCTHHWRRSILWYSIFWRCRWFPNIWVLLILISRLLHMRLKLTLIASLYIRHLLSAKLIVNVISKVVIWISSMMSERLTS